MYKRVQNSMFMYYDDDDDDDNTRTWSLIVLGTQ